MRIGRNTKEPLYTMTRKDEEGNTISVQLKTVEVEKDLGIYVDSNLDFKTHIYQAAAKANRLLGIIRRSFEHLHRDMIINLYKGQVRPLLEYGHSVWSLHHAGLTDELEKVQHRATKMIPELKDLPYPERLKRHKLPTLYHRGQRGDMIDTQKYLTGGYDTAMKILDKYEKEEQKTRGHNLKLQKSCSRLDVRKYFFSQQVVNLWNNLPKEVVEAPSMDSFKSRLDKAWNSRYTLYTPLDPSNRAIVTAMQLWSL